MLVKSLKIGLLSLLLTLISCMFDSGGELIKGRYNILWIDTSSNRSICYAVKNGELGGSQKVGAFIKEMGFNERYIIAKRIYFDPRKQMNQPDYDSISYYIIDMSKASDYKNDDVAGPFNEKEFYKMKATLGIANLQFSKEYQE